MERLFSRSSRGLTAGKMAFYTPQQKRAVVPSEIYQTASEGAQMNAPVPISQQVLTFPDNKVNIYTGFGVNDYWQASSGAYIFPTEDNLTADLTGLVINRNTIVPPPEDPITQIFETVPETYEEQQLLREELARLNCPQPVNAVDYIPPSLQLLTGAKSLPNGPSGEAFDLQQFISDYLQDRQYYNDHNAEDMDNYLVGRTSKFIETVLPIDECNVTVPQYLAANRMGPLTQGETVDYSADQISYDALAPGNNHLTVAALPYPDRLRKRMRVLPTTVYSTGTGKSVGGTELSGGALSREQIIENNEREIRLLEALRERRARRNEATTNTRNMTSEEQSSTEGPSDSTALVSYGAQPSPTTDLALANNNNETTLSYSPLMEETMGNYATALRNSVLGPPPRESRTIALAQEMRAMGRKREIDEDEPPTKQSRIALQEETGIIALPEAIVPDNGETALAVLDRTPMEADSYNEVSRLVPGIATTLQGRPGGDGSRDVPLALLQEIDNLNAMAVDRGATTEIAPEFMAQLAPSTALAMRRERSRTDVVPYSRQQPQPDALDDIIASLQTIQQRTASPPPGPQSALETAYLDAIEMEPVPESAVAIRATGALEQVAAISQELALERQLQDLVASARERLREFLNRYDEVLRALQEDQARGVNMALPEYAGRQAIENLYSEFGPFQNQFNRELAPRMNSVQDQSTLMLCNEVDGTVNNFNNLVLELYGLLRNNNPAMASLDMSNTTEPLALEIQREDALAVQAEASVEERVQENQMARSAVAVSASRDVPRMPSNWRNYFSRPRTNRRSQPAVTRTETVDPSLTDSVFAVKSEVVDTEFLNSQIQKAVEASIATAQEPTNEMLRSAFESQRQVLLQITNKLDTNEVQTVNPESVRGRMQNVLSQPTINPDELRAIMHDNNALVAQMRDVMDNLAQQMNNGTVNYAGAQADVEMVMQQEPLITRQPVEELLNELGQRGPGPEGPAELGVDTLNNNLKRNPYLKKRGNPIISGTGPVVDVPSYSRKLAKRLTNAAATSSIKTNEMVVQPENAKTTQPQTKKLRRLGMADLL